MGDGSIPIDTFLVGWTSSDHSCDQNLEGLFVLALPSWACNFRTTSWLQRRLGLHPTRPGGFCNGMIPVTFVTWYLRSFHTFPHPCMVDAVLSTPDWMWGDHPRCRAHEKLRCCTWCLKPKYLLLNFCASQQFSGIFIVVFNFPNWCVIFSLDPRWRSANKSCKSGLVVYFILWTNATMTAKATTSSAVEEEEEEEEEQEEEEEETKSGRKMSNEYFQFKD